jgi:hypothetical protein
LCSREQEPVSRTLLALLAPEREPERERQLELELEWILEQPVLVQMAPWQVVIF